MNAPLYRSDLARNLTPDEVDANFRFLFNLCVNGQPLVPSPPTFVNFQDTNQGGTVTVVAGDVPLTSVVYAPPGSSSFRAVPANGVIQVGDVAGQVQAKSLAIGRYLESAVSTSGTFTTAPATSVNATPQTYVTTAADYQQKFGQAWVGTYVGISRTSSAGTASTQAAANALALADATQQAIAAMVQQPVGNISFANVGNRTEGDNPFQLSATSTNAVTIITFTSSNPQVISVSGATATVVGAGTVTLTANQAAGNGYAAAPPAAQTVTVAAAPAPFDTTVSATLPVSSPGQAADVVLVAASTQRLRFTAIQSASGNVVQLQITDSSDNSVSYVSFLDDYSKPTPGRRFEFTRANGTTYAGTFPNQDTNFTA